MTEPAATSVFDLRLDNSKTEAEILALTDADNKLMIASDTYAVYTINGAGDKKLHGFVDGIQSSKNKLNATVAPIATDDSTGGYAVGSLWMNSSDGKLYKCNDATAATAIWEEVGTGAGSAATTVNAAEYTALYTDFTLDIQYAGATLITLPDTELAINGRLYTVSDGWRKNSILHPIRVQDEALVEIATIAFDGATLGFKSNGTSWEIVKHGDYTIEKLDVICHPSMVPLDFDAPVDMVFPTAVNRGNIPFVVSNGAEENRPTGKKYYVNRTTGSDLNDGLTPATAFAKVRVAILKSDVDEIIVAAGFYDRDFAMVQSPTRDVSIICPDGEALFTSTETLSYSTDVTYTNLEKATRSNCYAVYQRDFVTETGLFKEYILVGDLATANATPGSWYTDNVSIWVNPFGGYTVGFQTLAMLTVINGTATNVSIYYENIYFVGGTDSVKSSATTSTRIKLGMKNCKAFYAQNNGVSVVGGIDSIVENSEAADNKLDGFNYHYSPSTTEVPTSIEFNCKGYLNGTNATEINNGSTTHDAAYVARFGGKYYDNHGPNVHDVGLAKSWNVDCEAHDSEAITANEDFKIEGTMWLDNCVADLFGITSGTMYATYGSRVTVVSFSRFVRKLLSIW